MPPPSPTVAQWEIAVRLRQRRKELGIDAATVSSAVGVSRNYWSAVENDRTLLAKDKLEALAPVLEFSEAELGLLLELNETARMPRWWSEYEGLHANEDLMKLFGFEYGAAWIQTYESQLVTGLLQTEEYFRALAGANPNATEVSVRQRLKLRMRRQERIVDSADPLRLTLLMSEAAVTQQFGGPGVLKRQLEHLVERIDALPDSLEVRIIPFTSTPLGMTGASTVHLLGFDNPDLPTIVHREAVTALAITEDPDEVESIRVNYVRALGESSLDKEESRRLISERIETLASLDTD